MNINSNFFISMKRKSSDIITNLIPSTNPNDVNGTTYSPTSDQNIYAYLNKIYDTVTKSNFSVVNKNNMLKNLYKILNFTDDQIAERLMTTDEATSAPVDNSLSDQALRALCTKLIDFFREFNYDPSYRFVNTLAFVKDKPTYVKNYFKVMNHRDADGIAEKVKSAEFASICNTIARCKPTEKINDRITIFFGMSGAGKTVLCEKLSSKVIPCSSDMQPKDLMQIFDFTADGKATFRKSDLWEAMENGTTIGFDEFNMLPYESLKFIQSLTDNKKEICYEGHLIKIAPGFKIIGTMNLVTDDGTFPVPTAIADRAEVIKEFKLSADDLMTVLK